MVLVVAGAFASGGQESGAAGDSVEILNTDGAYPIVTEPITMSMAVGRYPDGTLPEEKWFWAYMEELTGITMDIQQLTPQNMQEQLNLMFATGELPDMMLHVGISNAQVSRYGGQGFFRPLEGLIENHAPNIRTAFDEVPLGRAAVTSPDGHIYMLPGIFRDKESFATQRPLLNRLWLQNLGLEAPRTLEDLHEVLRAFKEQDANGNGDPNDEIPFGGSWDEGYDERLPVLTALGFVSNGSRLAYRGGEVSYMPYDPLYEEFLTTMNSFWEEGLLDQDLFTQTESQAHAKYADGSVGLILAGAGFVFSEEHWLEYDAFSPLTSDWNDTPVWPEFAPINLSRFFLSTTADYPEAAIRWADWFFTTENSLTFWGGPLVGSEEAEMGGLTEYGRYFDETNRIQYRLPPEIDSSWQFVYRKASPVYGYNLGFVYGKGGNEKSWFFEEKLGVEPLQVAPPSFSTYLAEEPELGIFQSLGSADESRLRSMYDRGDAMYTIRQGVPMEDQAWAWEVLEDAGWIVDGTFLSKDMFWRQRFLANVTPNFASPYPQVFFTPEEVERLDELETPLEDYVTQMEARFITGVEPLERFSDYRASLEDLGAEEYLEIHQAAEARYSEAAGL
jgi:ABC-type glycerol-3-phosphate transport system substrate-binding protein